MDFDLIAKPLAVADAEPRSGDGRRAPFPVVEKLAAPSVANRLFTACSWEQIEFDIFKDLPDAVWKGTQPALGEDRAVAVPPPALQDFPEPVDGPVRPAASDGAGGIPKFWRRHRSRSAVAVYARNSVASIRRVWDAFTHLVVRGTQPALGEEPAAAVPPPALREFPEPVAGPIPPAASDGAGGIPKYWRRHRSRSAVVVFARNSVASIRRVWDAFTHLVVRGTQIALGKDRASAVPSPALREFPKPVADSPAAPNGSGRIAKYWRRHRSRSAVAVFARNSVASIRRVWHAFTHLVVRGAQTALGKDRGAAVASPALREFPKPVADSPAAPNGSGRIAKYWRGHRSHSAVAVFARNSVASIRRVWHAFTHLVVRGAQTALGKDRGAAVPSPALREFPKPVADSPAAPNGSGGIAKYWRGHRSHSAVAVFARNSVASVHRVLHALTDPVARYARSVSHSFVRDCRRLSGGVTMATPAVRFASTADGANASSNPRKALAPIVGWLRKPITPTHISSNRSPARSARRK